MEELPQEKVEMEKKEFAGLKENGPEGYPVRLISEYMRHTRKTTASVAETTSSEISVEGRKIAVAKGKELLDSGLFNDAVKIRMKSSPIERSLQTAEAIEEGYGTETGDKRKRNFLLGFGTAEFWKKYMSKVGESESEYLSVHFPNKEKTNLTDEEKIELAENSEIPVMKKWLNGEDKELVTLFSPTDAAADASIAWARDIGLLTRVIKKEGEETYIPTVTDEVVFVNITHRTVFEPLLSSGVLIDEKGESILDIEKLGGPIELLGGFRLVSTRDENGNIKAEVKIVTDKNKELEKKMFRVDISKLNELYKLGIIRNKEGIEWMIEERRKTQNKK